MRSRNHTAGSLRFPDWYSTEHRHSAIRYATPEQRTRASAANIARFSLDRHQLYQLARRAYPERWTRPTRTKCRWVPYCLLRRLRFRGEATDVLSYKFYHLV